MTLLTCMTAIFLAVAQPSPTATQPGYGPWSLGMTKEEVGAKAQFGPYSDVGVTGGLETPNGDFDGRKTNISFVFDDHGLYKLQIWAYEGKGADEAVGAYYRVYQYLRKQYGAVETPSLTLSEETEAAFASAVRKALSAQPADGLVKLHIAPAASPAGLSVFASLFRHPQFGYYVFLFYERP